MDFGLTPTFEFYYLFHKLPVHFYLSYFHILYLVNTIVRIFYIVREDKNIGNHRYISTSILRIYRKYIDGYFDTKY